MKKLLMIMFFVCAFMEVNAGVYEIPFLFYENAHILIEATVGDEGQKGFFVFDTGGGNILNKHRFSSLGNKRKVVLNSFQMGEWEAKKQKFVLDDYTKRFSKDFYQNLLGMLGPEVFEGKVFQINYEEQKLVIADRLSEIPSSLLTYEVPLSIDKIFFKVHRLLPTYRVSLELETHEFPNMYLKLDTGDPGTFSHFTGYLKRQKKLMGDAEIKIDTIKVNSKVPYALSKSARSEGYIVTTHNASLGDYNIESLPVVFTSNGPNTVGNGFLRDYIVTVDWKTKKMYLSSKLD